MEEVALWTSLLFRESGHFLGIKKTGNHHDPQFVRLFLAHPIMSIVTLDHKDNLSLEERPSSCLSKSQLKPGSVISVSAILSNPARVVASKEEALA